jgi:hypothetical protein
VVIAGILMLSSGGYVMAPDAAAKAKAYDRGTTAILAFTYIIFSAVSPSPLTDGLTGEGDGR